jgi:hypothetical protein
VLDAAASPVGTPITPRARLKRPVPVVRRVTISTDRTAKIAPLMPSSTETVPALSGWRFCGAVRGHGDVTRYTIG